MKDETTFTGAGWDFNTVWDIDGSTNNGYPFLRDTYNPPGIWVWKSDISDTDWETGSNWEDEEGTEQTNKPAENAEVRIPNNTNGAYPILDAENAIIYDLFIANNSELTIAGGIKLTIINEATGAGTVDGDGEIVFAGSVPQDIPFSSVENLTIDNRNNVKLGNSITVTNELDLQNGYMNLNENVLTLDPTASIENETNDSRIVSHSESGTVVTTRTLDATDTYELGNIGVRLTISETTLGETTITRGHNIQEANGNKSIARWFDIEPATTTGLNVDLDFAFFDSELTDVIKKSTLGLWRSDDDGSTWSSVSGSLNDDEDTLTATGVSSFSRWTAADEDNPLPVSWLYFSGERIENGHIMLYWATATEINSDYFVIQRSQTGEDFITRGVAIGSGNTNQVVSYEFPDKDVDSETWYYRLKQVDYDGQYEYSKTIVIAGTQEEQELKVFPNPAASQVTVIFPEPLIKDTKLHLYKSPGQKVQSLTLPAYTRQHTLEFSPDMAKGLYFIKIDGENGAFQKLMIK